MHHLLFQTYRAEHERMLREIASRPRFSREDPREPGWARRRLATLRSSSVVPTRNPGQTVTIRRASAADASQLAELAALSERRVPTGPVLVAQVEYDLVAALPLAGGPALADITRATADVVQLLELRSEQLRRAQRAA
jgi:hypothetical protein